MWRSVQSGAKHRNARQEQDEEAVLRAELDDAFDHAASVLGARNRLPRRPCALERGECRAKARLRVDEKFAEVTTSSPSRARRGPRSSPPRPGRAQRARLEAALPYHDKDDLMLSGIEDRLLWQGELLAEGNANVTSTKLSGRKRPPALETSPRTRTVRVAGSRIGSTATPSPRTCGPGRTAW
jgi:hypothetical protein